MEKRALIALGLSFVILLIYQFLFVKPVPQQVSQQSKPVEQEQTVSPPEASYKRSLEVPMVSLFLRLSLAVALYLSLAGQQAPAEGPRIIPVPPGVTPQWTRVPGASKLYYAPNIPTDLFRYKGSYYFFWNSMWYKGATVRGPWTPTFQVPPSLRTLDPSYLKTARPGAGPAESMTPGPGAAPGPGGSPVAAAGRPLPPGAKPWVPPGREGATATPGLPEGAPQTPGVPGLETQRPEAGAMAQWTPPPPEVSQPVEEPGYRSGQRIKVTPGITG